MVGGEGQEGWAPCQPISWRALIAWAEIAAALACLLFLLLSVQANVERLCRGRACPPRWPKCFSEAKMEKGEWNWFGLQSWLVPSPRLVFPTCTASEEGLEQGTGYFMCVLRWGVKARRGEERATAGKMPGSHQGASRGFPLISFLRCHFVT